MASSITAQPHQTATAVRGLVIYTLLSLSIILMGIGLSILIGNALQGFRDVAQQPSQLAMGLTFTAVSIPLSLVLRRSILKKLDQASSLDWSLHSLQGALVYLVSLVISVVAGLQLLSGWVDLVPVRNWQQLLGTSLGWGAICVWQYRSLHKIPPRQWPNLAPALGVAFSLLLCASSWAAVLHQSLRLLIFKDQVLLGPSPLSGLLSASVWALGASLLWFAHWKIQRVQLMLDAFTSLVIAVVGVWFAAAATMAAAAVALNTFMPMPWNLEAIGTRMESYGLWALAWLLIGALMWIYHSTQLNVRGPWLQEVSQQIISGMSLALMASGLGMVVNALLSAMFSVLNQDAAPDVLRSGSALLLVGAVVWAWHFKPLQPARPGSRRIYLILFFGVSSLVALAAVLTIVYRLLQTLLGQDSATGNLIDELRAPIGWLVATMSVAAYHFTLFKADRRHQSVPRTDVSVEQDQRMLIVVAPLKSDRLLSALNADENIRLHWIASASPFLIDEQSDQLLARITEYFYTTQGSVLASIEEDGDIRFTQLA